MNTNTNTGAQTPATPSDSPKAQQPAMSGPLRPRWCVQRDANTVVPLIAIDELPLSILLKDVPSTLTLLEALKTRMELIAGDHPAHGIRYQLHQPIKTHIASSEEGNDSGSDGSPRSEGSEASTQKELSASDKKGKKNNTRTWSEGFKLSRPTLATKNHSIFDTMGRTGTMGKKVYCTFWIQTGSCNYMQEGCKYKHEIPTDRDTLRALGFREPPHWVRDELSDQPDPLPAHNKPWRHHDGKPAHPGAVGPSNRAASSPATAHPGAVGPSNRAASSPATAHGTPIILARGNGHASARATSSPATAHGTPIILARGNGHASARASNHGPYNSNATAFAAPHQHFPTHANHMAQQRPFSQGGQSFLGNGAAENYQQRSAQNNASPPSYNLPAQDKTGGRSRSSSPAKQPPISRPTKLGQPSIGQQQNNMGASTQKVAPDHHVVNRASGTSGGAAAASFARQGYSGLHNNWNPQTNATTSMDISFIAPSSDSTRSGSQVLYTPTYTPLSTSATPTLKNANIFGSLNGNATSDPRANTPAQYNGKSSANNNGNALPVKGRGPIQFGPHSPAPSTGSAQPPFQASAVAEESDATSLTSPPVQHRVFFREPGQPEYVTNPPEPKGGQNGKAAHGLRKHPRKAHGSNGAKSQRAKMNGNGYELLVDVLDQ